MSILNIILLVAGIGILIAAVLQLMNARARTSHMASLLKETKRATERLKFQMFRDQLCIQNEMKREAGIPIFTKDMRVGLALNSDGRVNKLLTKLRGSGVIKIEYEFDKTLEEVSEQYDINCDKLIAALNDLK